MIRRRLAIVCFLATAAAAINPVLLRMPFSNRAGLGAALTAMPERAGYYPDYPLFLADVRSHTRDGDRIALFVPDLAWRGYDHAFFRATYLLYGREILPVLARDDKPMPQNVAAANYIAMWNVTPATTLGTTVVASHRGRLIRVR
jgi:hypothetical protein